MTKSGSFISSKASTESQGRRARRPDRTAAPPARTRCRTTRRGRRPSAAHARGLPADALEQLARRGIGDRLVQPLEHPVMIEQHELERMPVSRAISSAASRSPNRSGRDRAEAAFVIDNAGAAVGEHEPAHRRRTRAPPCARSRARSPAAAWTRQDATPRRWRRSRGRSRRLCRPSTTDSCSRARSQPQSRSPSAPGAPPDKKSAVNIRQPI